MVWGHIITIGHSWFSLMIYSLAKRENCTGAHPCGQHALWHIHPKAFSLHNRTSCVQTRVLAQCHFVSIKTLESRVTWLFTHTGLLSVTVHRKWRVGCLQLYSCCSFRQRTRSIVLVTKYDIAVGLKSLALALVRDSDLPLQSNF